MTTWGYRVVKHTPKVLPKESHVWFDICEVYCDRHGKLSWTVEGKAPIGDSPDELKDDLNMMLNACDLPVLEEKDGTLLEVNNGTI